MPEGIEFLEQQFIGTGPDGLQVAGTPHEDDPAAQYGLPQLEIVNEMEEDIYPQRTSHDSDYELSDTPYSSQNLGGAQYMSQPAEMSPDKLVARGDSSHLNKKSCQKASQNAYHSYISDFNPQTEIHVSWQDTIAEASVEDEELLSSQSSLQISRAYIVDQS